MEEDDPELALALAMSLSNEHTSGGGQEASSPTGPAPKRAATSPAGTSSEGKLVRRVVPADNSCLFTAIGCAMEDGAMDRASSLRELVAAILFSTPDRFSEAELGMPLEVYCDKIMGESWGGGIDLAVLSEHFSTEFAVFNIQTQRSAAQRSEQIFGQGQGYKQRVLLIFDGTHYDLLVKQPFEGAPTALDVRIFEVTDDIVLQMARELCLEANRQKQFTDLAKFKLRCLVCQKGLVGEADAQAHAQETAKSGAPHINFAEY